MAHTDIKCTFLTQNLPWITKLNRERWWAYDTSKCMYSCHSVSCYFSVFTGQNVLSKQENGLKQKKCKSMQNLYFVNWKLQIVYTINWQLVFTNLVYMVGEDSVKRMYGEIIYTSDVSISNSSIKTANLLQKLIFRSGILCYHITENQRVMLKIHFQWFFKCIGVP